MIPTPRTDAAQHEGLIRGCATPAKVVRADFARQLERDITELNDRLIDRKPCDWKQDDDGNWDTSCKQCMCFEYAPPVEQGYKFCHHCGLPINFIKFIKPLDESLD